MMEKTFQTLKVIPENVENASRFGPGFSIGSDRGALIRSEHALLVRVAMMACGVRVGDVSTHDVQHLVDRVDALHGLPADELIYRLQGAGDRLLEVVNGSIDPALFSEAYLDTIVYLFALARR
jgi:hypothetical protein